MSGQIVTVDQRISQAALAEVQKQRDIAQARCVEMAGQLAAFQIEVQRLRVEVEKLQGELKELARPARPDEQKDVQAPARPEPGVAALEALVE